MFVTLPWPGRTRLTVRTRGLGWSAVRWKPLTGAIYCGFDDDEPDAGVREPRRPKPQSPHDAVQSADGR